MKSKTITHCLSLSAPADAPGAGVRKVCEGRLEHLERSRQVVFASVSAVHILYVCCYICCYILVTEVLGITSSAGGYYINITFMVVITITA